jgi:hypothetical protein
MAMVQLLLSPYRIGATLSPAQATMGPTVTTNGERALDAQPRLAV